MQPVDFRGRNVVLGAPVDAPEGSVLPLPVWSDGREYVSCWSLSAEEVAEIARTKRLWIMVIGRSHPPILPVADCPLVVP